MVQRGMTINWYGIIVLSGPVIGIVSASVLSRLCGISRRTIAYTAFLNIFCMLLSSVFAVIIFSGGKLYGLSGLGGAFGLMLGTLISMFIHNDHPREMLSSWVVSAPLMYAVSKLACLYAGCCGGTFMGIPVQLVMSVSFFVVYILSVIVFFVCRDKARATVLAMTSAFVVRIALDFWHDSHVGKIVTREQILVLVAGGMALILYALRRRLPFPRG